MSHPFADEGDSAYSRGTEPMRAAGADELQDLLSTIVDQLADADRRHGETLTQMQERLDGIGREAQALRERFPEQFAEAFDRIETGMAEMSARIVDAQSQRMSDIEAAGMGDASAPLAPPATMGSPAVLRSAVEADGVGSARSNEARLPAGVDTFDVIESSVSGKVDDPWDNHAADTLASFYASGENFYGAGLTPPVEVVHQPTSQAAVIYPSTPFSTDQAWLEARFAEIAAKIEQSLAEIRPDHGFFALGQRFDQLEMNLGRFIDDVARGSDTENLSEIRSHIGDVARHLEQAHRQLTRLDAIEEQLGSITARLDDVHRVAMQSSEGTDDTPAPVDVSELARVAAQEAAKTFAELNALSERDNIRPMLERMMAESHQSGENTATLLDTIQQAMIRLLDRVDALEMAKRSVASPSHSAPPAVSFNPARHFVPTPPPSAFEIQSAPIPPVPTAAIDAELEDLLEPVAGEFQPPLTSPPVRQRHDFVADARRARMRLESETMAAEAAKRPAVASEMARDAGLKPQPVASGAGAAKASSTDSKKPASGSAKKTIISQPKSAGPSAPSLRLVVVAVLVLAALAGLWVTSATKGRAPAIDKSHSSGSVPLSEDALPELPSVGEPAKSAPRGGLELRDGTRGEIVPGNVRVGSSDHPMLGVAVDTSKPLTAEDLQRSRRQQAMAGLSGQLGDAAAFATRDLVTPASLVPDTPNVRDAAREVDAAVRNGELAVSTPLDLPPATVGPLSLRLAAANGDPSAAFEVGSRMAEGKGTTQSFADAAKWYLKAASRNFVPAQYRLGTLYERGLGVGADAGRAQVWYKRAAEQGNIKAMHNLAVLSANQSNGSPDYTTAAHWFAEAAQRGLRDSQFNLAVLYENGLGVEKDMKQAFKWLSLAASGGDSDAVRRRDVLRGKLTAAEMSEAEVLIAIWRPTPPDPAVNDARAAGEAWKKSAG